MADQILVLDEGTTSTRAMLFAADGQCRAVHQQSLTQFYPADGHVEHDAAEIWSATLACARAAIADAGGWQAIAGIGITNQRETVVAWDRRSGTPVHRAIVWQDRRTAAICDSLRDQGHEPVVQARTGLLLDPYFSGTKMGWLMRHCAAAAELGPHLAMGTIESWLVWNLTGGLHISDASNASRTMMLALDGVASGAAAWDDELVALMGVPRSALPEITDCAGRFGTTDPALFGGPIPICALIGDQQAATIGQGCLTPGDAKATFGTGAFVLTNTGHDLPRSGHRLLGTILHQLDGQRTYALEGSVFVAGSLIQWLRDGLGVIAAAGETASLAASVDDNGGVYLVPALSGLGAPHWRPDARAQISGLSFATGKAHLARAALEAMAYQTHDLMTAFAADRARWSRLKIDGGMSANDWMAQDLADMLDVPVERPDFVETTALGAAMLAAVGSGLAARLDDTLAMRGAVQHFSAQIDPVVRDKRLAGWQAALAKV